MEDFSGGAPSRAAVKGHPLHPMLVPFPIAFLVAAFLTDVAYWSSADLFWARASLWLIGAGLAGGVLAALLGLVDFLSIRRAREHAVGWIHFLGNASVVVLALVNLMLRRQDMTAAVVPVGLLLSAVTVALLLVTGWCGGELAYRHRIGVLDDARADAAPRRPA